MEIFNYNPRVNLSIPTFENNFGSSSAIRMSNNLHIESDNQFQQIVEYLKQNDIKKLIVITAAKNISLIESLYKIIDQKNLIFIFHYPVHHENLQSKSYYINLTLYQEIDQVFDEISNLNDYHVLVIECLEHLSEIRPVLRNVREYIKSKGTNTFFLTPNAAHKKYLISTDGLPFNPDYTRLWKIDEICDLLYSSGYNNVKQGFLSSSNTHQNDYVFVTSSCDEEYYRSFLIKANLPNYDGHYCICTTEHKLIKPTGGIGTYVYHAQKVYNCLIVYFDGDIKISYNTVFNYENNIILPQYFFSENSLRQFLDYNFGGMGETFAKSMDMVFFFYPKIDLVEFQEYNGIGHRIIQKSKSGLYPEFISNIVCHGSHIYLSHLNQQTPTYENRYNILTEKYTIENANITTLISNYLKNLYLDYGYKLEKNNHILRNPYIVSKDYYQTDFEGLKNIFFVGKKSVMKGYKDFLEIIHNLTDKYTFSKENKQIKKIFIFSTSGEDTEETLALKNKISNKGIKIIEKKLNNTKLIETIKKIKNNSVCLLPYKGDNYPYVVLELIELGAPFLAYNTGGIPEIIPEEFHSYIISEPNTRALYEKLINFISQGNENISNLVNNLRNNFIDKQEKNNKVFVEFQSQKYTEYYKKSHSTSKIEKDLVSVVVPVYNTDLNQIRELCISINRSGYLPKEVIFVNDGSEEIYSKKLEECINQHIKVPYKIIYQENKGLAGARNTGIKTSTTKYTIFLDSDDVVFSETIYYMIKFLETNQEYHVVTTYLKYFYDNYSYEKFDLLNGGYLPILHDNMIGLGDNISSSSFLCIKTQVIRENNILYDDTDKSKFEDWAYNIKLKFNGINIGIIPTYLYHYRIRQNSMLRTYPPYFGLKRLARNALFLNKFDAFILIGLLQDLKETKNKYWSLHHAYLKAADDYKNLETEFFKSINNYRNLEIEIVKTAEAYQKLETEFFKVIHKNQQLESGYTNLLYSISSIYNKVVEKYNVKNYLMNMRLKDNLSIILSILKRKFLNLLKCNIKKIYALIRLKR